MPEEVLAREKTAEPSEATVAESGEPDGAASLMAVLTAGENGDALIGEEAPGDEAIGLDIDEATLAAVVPVQKAPLLALDAAFKRIGPEVFAALQKNFNGELSAVRYPDEGDRIF